MARQHCSKETRELIISSAIENFLKKGYAKTTLEDIVRHVGLTRGAFYWNFESKRDILDEIVARYEQFYLDIYANYQKFDSAYDTLRCLLIHNLKCKNRPNPYNTIIRYKVVASEEISDLTERQRNLDQKFVGIFSDEIRRGQEQGSFSRDHHPRQLAIMVYTFLLGFDSYNAVNFEENADHFVSDEDIEQFVDRLLKILD